MKEQICALAQICNSHKGTSKDLQDEQTFLCKGPAKPVKVWSFMCSSL